MTPLHAWIAQAAAPLTPEDCRAQASLIRAHAAGTPAHLFDTIERLQHVAATWDRMARRLAWARGDEVPAAHDAAFLGSPRHPHGAGAHLAGA